MRKELRVVIDTNVIISAAIGKSATLLSVYNAFMDGLFSPVLSPALLEEILNVAKRPRIKKLFRAKELKRFQELLKIDAILVRPFTKLSLSRDPKDDIILEAAVGAKADLIVTGDKDLLTLKNCAGIPIVTAHQFLNILKKL